MNDTLSPILLKEGDKAPHFSVPDENGTIINLSDLLQQQKSIILYFYPKDDTPGCTAESCDFRDNLVALNQLNALVLGASKDSVKSHQKFKKKYDLNFPILADEEQVLCRDYGVLVEKSMYGKTYLGIERTSFLINPDGTIKRIWRKVSVNGHVEDIKAALNT
jgi:peroxiredoxin Q/BCP